MLHIWGCRQNVHLILRPCKSSILLLTADLLLIVTSSAAICSYNKTFSYFVRKIIFSMKKTRRYVQRIGIKFWTLMQNRVFLFFSDQPKIEFVSNGRLNERLWGDFDELPTSRSAMAEWRNWPAIWGNMCQKWRNWPAIQGNKWPNWSAIWGNIDRQIYLFDYIHT